MPTEREVKYQVLDQALFRRLAAMDHIGDFALEHAGVVDMVTLYLDTPDLSLFSRQYALRLRFLENRAILSLKGPTASPDADVQERPEDEVDAPGFSERLLPSVSEIVRLLPASRELVRDEGGDLSVSLRCHNKRALHYVMYEGDRAYEIACDTVTFTSPRKPGTRADAAELEIEQKAGSAQGLEQLARAFETFFAVVPRRASSKYQDGLRALGLIP